MGTDNFAPFTACVHAGVQKRPRQSKLNMHFQVLVYFEGKNNPVQEIRFVQMVLIREISLRKCWHDSLREADRHETRLPRCR